RLGLLPMYRLALSNSARARIRRLRDVVCAIAGSRVLRPHVEPVRFRLVNRDRLRPDRRGHSDRVVCRLASTAEMAMKAKTCVTQGNVSACCIAVPLG